MSDVLKMLESADAKPAKFDWPRRSCPCGDVQQIECQRFDCKWERDPNLVPERLRRQVANGITEPAHA